MRADSAVEPTKSENITLTWRRSALSSGLGLGAWLGWLSARNVLSTNSTTIRMIFLLRRLAHARAIRAARTMYETDAMSLRRIAANRFAIVTLRQRPPWQPLYKAQ